MTAEGDRLRANAPKGVLTADLRSQIADRKAEIIAALNSARAFSPPPVSRRPANDPAPLSFAQDRLWFLEQLEPGSGVYGICRASRLIGDLNVPALDASLNEIVRRHEVLRSAFRETDGRPLQVTLPAPELALSLIDLRGPPAPDGDEVLRWVREEAARPLDLRGGLLLRGSLLRVGDATHILTLTTHHIVSDAWSMGILTRELWSLYEAYAAGKKTRLKDLPIQYADFASWQREWLQGEILESQLSYWRKQLHDIPILNLPTDRTRPGRQSFCGARQSITLSQSLTTAVHELSQRQSVTPFMSLLAAFLALLYRYSGQDDVVVGSPIANRSRTEFESLIGLFVNTLVLRSDLSGNPTFRELLARVREVCLGAYAHQDLPFEKLVQELQPERDRSRNPLFQVMFVLQNATRPFTELPGLRVEPIELGAKRSPFDLSLFLRERDGRFIGYFEYSTDLFERETIARMAAHFERLLEGIVTDPDQPISKLPILTEAERQQILVEWNNTEAEYPTDKCIHELFEEQVERTPEAIALEFEGEEIAYRELNRRANQLAHYLTRLGIGPERLVGIYVERSIEMVIGLLGILKSGGAYVPLDPRYPQERIKFMIDDARISALLVQKKSMSAVNYYQGLTIPLDHSQPFWHENEEDSKKAASSDAPAYVTYTSGSTGLPKGVIGTHRGAVNRFTWMWTTFPFETNETGCVKTSLSFVDSVWELFGPMLKGVRLVLIPDNVVQDTPRFVQKLARSSITRVVLVPSLLQSIFDTIPDIHDRLPDLKIWLSSGESLPEELADQFRTLLPGRKLLNLYGSSEVAADVTFYDCGNREPGTNMRIGRPINNTQTYILDSWVQPVPIGVPGELYVGGAGLASGYFNRPELTSEKFIRSPFGDDANSRLYRTGDLTRYKPDGNIEFLGRLDDQVKVRGYRIELAEIESAIMQHPGLNRCVVTVQKNEASGGNQLIGYIVPLKRSECAMTEVRRFVAAKLPEYMVPSQFVVLDHLPLMPNGKVDRNVLPSVDAVTPQLTEGFVEPRTEMEELVAQAWREILKLERIGVHDNFFQIGGHSLLAAQIVSKLRGALANHLSLRTFFEAPTIAGLAYELEKTIRADDESDLPPIVPVSHKGALPVSISQEPFFVVDQLIGGASFFNLPYAYRLSGPLKVSALVRTIQEIVRRHASLRTVFADINDRATQTVRSMSKIKLPLIDLTQLSLQKKEQELKRLSSMDARRRFKLRSGPVFRVKLIRLDEQEHVLLVTMHHIVTDQWSMSVFRSELGTLYGAFSLGQSSPLSIPSLQFVDFVIWQKCLLKEGFLKRQISYWKKQLAEPLSTLDFQRGSKRRRKRIRFRSARQPVEIDVALFQAIKAFARRENCTTFMVFTTALMILLHLLTDERDIRISTLVANRGQPGTEGIIGYFVNLLILRNYVSPDMSGRQLLKEVRDICLSAYARQDLPFDYLESLLEKEGNKKPLSQVMLNYRNFPTPPRKICGLTIASWDAQGRIGDPGLMISRQDMMIHLRDTATKLTGAVNYKTDLFTDVHITKIMNSFRQILNHLSVQSDTRVVDYLVHIDA